MGSLKLNIDFKSVNKEWIGGRAGSNVNFDEKQGIDIQVRAPEKDSVSRKRKREHYVSMLNWIDKVAKDPFNRAIGPLPEKHKWKCYERDLPWKQILLVREALLLKKNADASSELSVWQKNQKMHPSMYDDGQCGTERLRSSQRLLFAKDTSCNAPEQPAADSSSSSYQSDEDFADKQSDSTSDSACFWFKFRRQKRVPLGMPFQADLPEFSRAYYTSDSKWLGTKIWPLEKGEYNTSLIERDPIGKGRQELCGCQYPGCLECVKFHVQEKRIKVKLELGPAFYRWKFDGMGEDVSLFWRKVDEITFQNIVGSNRLLSEKCFWDELFKSFPKKGREALVSYYFNVFLLRRRGEQNRSTTSDIYSDDEESEFGPIGNRFGQTAAKWSIFFE